MRDIRQERHWTLDALAERLLELHNEEATDDRVASWRTIVHRTERGGRHITLDDWLLFAAALGVSPLALLPWSGEIRIAGLRLPADVVTAWMEGKGPLRRDDVDVYESNRWAPEFLLDPDYSVGNFVDRILDKERPPSRDEKEAVLAFLARQRKYFEDTLKLSWLATEAGREACEGLKSELEAIRELEKRVEAAPLRRPTTRKRKETPDA